MDSRSFLKLEIPEQRAQGSKLSPYGATDVAAEYCGLARVPWRERGLWQHGWTAKHYQFHPDCLFGTLICDRKDRSYWVARKDEEEYLKSHGFRNVRAIGLPLVYTSDTGLPRIQDSLLVMPAHSLPYTTHEWDGDAYARQIADIRDDFAHVVVCIHPSCWEHGNWVNAFRKHGLQVVRGAGFADANALRRIRYLCSTFEYITTNAFGSHLGYGAYMNAKVSIFGPYAEQHSRDMYNTPFYRENPGVLELTTHGRSEECIRDHYPQFFVDHPRQAVNQTEWARFQLGHENRVPPCQLRRLFGWDWMSRRRAQIRLGWKKVGRLLPEPVKDRWRRFEDRTEREIARLKTLPRSEKTTTDLLGRQLTIPDAHSFLNDYESIFEHRVLRFVTTSRSPYIIDGGPGIGLSIVYFKQQYPDSQIVAYEPDLDAFRMLQENCKSFNLADVKLVHTAFSTSQPPLRLQQLEENAECVPNNAGAPDKIHVPFVCLRNVLHRKVDFLRLDVAGSEIELLKDCADQLYNVEHLFLEYHCFADKKQTLAELMSLLVGTGFRLHIHSRSDCKSPFVYRPVIDGFDLRLQVFAFRDPRFTSENTPHRTIIERTNCV